MIKMENDVLSVEIAEHGAELTKLYNKKTGTDLLWDAEPQFWKRHSPVLFPNVGKTYKNTVKINGTQYPTSQHGFARDSEFKCIHAGKDETIYFTIGAHPAFRFAKNEEGKTDYILKFPGKDELKYCLINMKEMAPDPEELHEMKLNEETYPLTEELFENDALIFDNTQIEEAWICHKDGTPYVGVKSEGFPSYGIWSVKDAPFVCLEPWMGRCDNIGFDKEISEKPGINKVEVGETFEKEYQIIAAVE